MEDSLTMTIFDYESNSQKCQTLAFIFQTLRPICEIQIKQTYLVSLGNFKQRFLRQFSQKLCPHLVMRMGGCNISRHIGQLKLLSPSTGLVL